MTSGGYNFPSCPLSAPLTPAAWRPSSLCPWPPSWPASAQTWPAPAVPSGRRSESRNGDLVSKSWTWTQQVTETQSLFWNILFWISNHQQFLRHTDDQLSETPHFGLKVRHGLLEGLWRRPLVVAENCHGSVGAVIRQQLFCLIVRLWREKNTKKSNSV